MTKRFYVDACIWLNLFKKEGDPTKGVPYWEIARDFIKYVKVFKGSIFVSSAVLKELTFKLRDKFSLAKEFFDRNKYIKLIKNASEDYDFARKLESNLKYELSFFDCIHISIAKRLNLNLVTRDKGLLKIAKKYVTVNKPEELIN